MPSDAKQPVLLKRKIRLEQQANELLEDLAQFIGTSAEDALNIVLKKMMANDANFQRWRCQQAVPQEGSPVPLDRLRMQRTGRPHDRANTQFPRHARMPLAMATGMTLYFSMPFPDDNIFFELMYLRASPVFWGFKCTYILHAIHDAFDWLFNRCFRACIFSL